MSSSAWELSTILFLDQLVTRDRGIGYKLNHWAPRRLKPPSVLMLSTHPPKFEGSSSWAFFMTASARTRCRVGPWCRSWCVGASVLLGSNPILLCIVHHRCGLSTLPFRPPLTLRVRLLQQRPPAGSSRVSFTSPPGFCSAYFRR